jgi:dolichol-phosphate mannosyltransferase
VNETPRLSVVMPIYNEPPEIVQHLDRLFEAVDMPCEVLAVYDTDDDTTVPVLREYAARQPQLRPTLNSYGRGPANALRYGIDHATAPVTVVTMSDGSDDFQQIEPLTRLVERGVVIACASRYMRGGQQVGGPYLKGLLSRMAGLSLHTLARVGTHDATNSFKAYSTEFLRSAGVSSSAGFELGLEMVAKARRRRLPIAELPTIWLDRAAGQSNFKARQWLPHYLRWYLHAFGRDRRR